MIFITKKKLENEVRSRVEKELCLREENRYRSEEIRELHKRCERLEMRLEKVEKMHDIPTDLSTKPTW